MRSDAPPTGGCVQVTHLFDEQQRAEATRLSVNLFQTLEQTAEGEVQPRARKRGRRG